MKRSSAELSLFLDHVARDLADDLQWALERIDHGAWPRANRKHAQRYRRARSHLEDRRRYEQECKQTGERG